jgi:hypothetical protein
MSMKAEYKEGPEARENFERFTSALLQVPKKKARKAAKKKATSRKKSGKDKG